MYTDTCYIHNKTILRTQINLKMEHFKLCFSRQKIRNIYIFLIITTIFKKKYVLRNINNEPNSQIPKSDQK